MQYGVTCVFLVNNHFDWLRILNLGLVAYSEEQELLSNVIWKYTSLKLQNNLTYIALYESYITSYVNIIISLFLFKSQSNIYQSQVKGFQLCNAKVDKIIENA